jgi:tRNA isopentenyl-2-thiomethyl-A-37 hydroxylase MiaE
MVDAAFMQQLRLKPDEVLNLKLNKAIYHFYNEDYKVALQQLLSIEHSNAWCAKVAGIEWVVKKDLLDLFIQYELGNLDIAANKIRAMQRHKYSSGKLPQMERVLVFLNLINQMVDDPAITQTKRFYNLVEESFDWIPIEQEDLHASVYYAWMKARIVKQKPYQVLLDLILIE